MPAQYAAVIFRMLPMRLLEEKTKVLTYFSFHAECIYIYTFYPSLRNGSLIHNVVVIFMNNYVLHKTMVMVTYSSVANRYIRYARIISLHCGIS